MEIALFMSWPVIGALIGWLTNLLAVRMLFHPREPVVIPGLGWQIQGLIPKRKADFAHSVGKAVSEELLPIEHVLGRIDQKQYQLDILSSVVTYIDDKLHALLPTLIPSSLRNRIRDVIADWITREGQSLLEDAFQRGVSKLQAEIDIGQMVEEQILSFDTLQLEQLVIATARKELRHIELLGGVLGFFIGIVQSLLLALLR